MILVGLQYNFDKRYTDLFNRLVEEEILKKEDPTEPNLVSGKRDKIGFKVKE